ncbi:MAG: ornithine cyclodeaminase family protein [Alphaproteobacteria bacterium]
MPLYLTEDDVGRLVGVEDAIEALEDCFPYWEHDGACNMPRQRLALPERAVNIMAASVPQLGVFGTKVYFRGCFHVTLYDIEARRMLALIEANLLGALRTGAASGVATRALARAEASTLGMIGTGKQARTQLLAIAAVRTLTDIRVFGRDAGRRAAFADEMAAETGLSVTPCESAEACVAGADIVVAATNAAEPVVLGDWLAPGAHVNAVGANAYARRELDEQAVRRAALVVVDDRDQATIEARELIDLADAGALDWADVAELGPLLRGDVAGRAGDGDITLYKSLGVAFEDVVFAKTIHDRALAAGAGQPFAE